MSSASVTRKCVALSLIKGFGAVTFKKLYEALGSVDAIWQADSLTLQRLAGKSQLATNARCDGVLLKMADREIQIARENDIRIITRLDEDYPRLLSQIYDPPFVLYARGKWPLPETAAVAVVGSRACSSYGRRIARVIARDLSNAGVTIVSGMALGIDSAAHEGALDGTSNTVAVIGSGLLKLYPSENEALARRIAMRGTVLSEFTPHTGALPQHFPMRNRILSGLCRAVVVAEARRDSGALITVDCALEQGRDVYSVPGNIDSQRSDGTNYLIQQGARLLTSVSDILADLRRGGFLQTTAIGPDIPLAVMDDTQRQLMAFFEGEPLSVDELTERSGWPASKTASVLGTLLIKKILRELPGKYFDLHENYVTLAKSSTGQAS